MPRPSTLAVLFCVLFPALALGAPRASKRRSAGPAVTSDLELRPQVTPPGPAEQPLPRERARDGEGPAPRPDGRPAAVRPPKLGDAEMRELWARWRSADAQGSPERAEEAAKALLEAKDELGIADLEPFSVAVSRQARRHYEANDPVGAIELSRFAVDLAPHLPWARFSLARTYFLADPASVGQWVGELRESVVALWRDPRHLRPAVADMAVAAIAALLATAIAGIAVLFFRRARYFLHDFHHLFPRAAARWQTQPIALLLLGLPLVFRLGLVPVLAVLLASVALYLDWAERLVGAALLAVLALVPLLGHAVTEATLAAGTVAQDVQDLERGGLQAARAAQAVKARLGEQRAEFAEVYALGRFALRRGRLEEAADVLKKAALIRGNDARLLTGLGNVRMGAGDEDGAFSLYTQARDADPTAGAALYNLARVRERRARTLGPAEQALEREQVELERALAAERDPSLGERPEPAADETRLNLLVVTPELPWSEIRPLAVVPDAADRVQAQLSRWLVGGAEGAWTWLLPGMLALLAVGIGALRPVLRVSQPCEKCGLAACRRCDPDLVFASGLCTQCINVFTRKGLVPPQLKVRKQLEVIHHQSRRERLSWLLGIVCSGGGHLFTGRPIRGVLFAFAALFLICSGVLGEGAFRAPYGEVPLALRLAPVALTFAVVYLLSLRSLRKSHIG
jgi:hypothetical protein